MDNVDYYESSKNRNSEGWKDKNGVRKYLRVILLEDGQTFHNAFLIGVLRRKNHEDKIFSGYRYTVD